MGCYENPRRGRKAYRRAIHLPLFYWKGYYNYGISIFGSKGFSLMKDLKNSLFKNNGKTLVKEMLAPCKSQK